MSTPSHGGYRPAKLEPTPRYPHIILALNIVSITPPRFHWLIFVPAPGEDEDEVEVEVGTKVHAIRLFRRAFGSPNPAEIWRFEATTFTLSTSGSVVAAAIIGQLKDKTEKQLVDLLEEIPMDIPPWTETVRMCSAAASGFGRPCAVCMARGSSVAPISTRWRTRWCSTGSLSHAR